MRIIFRILECSGDAHSFGKFKQLALRANDMNIPASYINGNIIMKNKCVVSIFAVLHFSPAFEQTAWIGPISPP
jgi:hypothetical protein